VVTSPFTGRYRVVASSGDVTSDFTLEKNPGDDNEPGASRLAIISYT
jgi:hypothetical protein